MSAGISPLAGKLPAPGMLVDVAKLVTAYYSERPDPGVPAQRVAFGTSGHRGSSFDRAFNEWHILAITQAICEYRRAQGTNGPLFMGFDTHALSAPACASALEVLAGERSGCDARRGGRVHADAGRVACDHRVQQRAARRDSRMAS